MQAKLLLTTSILALTALAGCADNPPAGTIGFDGHAIVLSGEADFDIMPAENHYPLPPPVGPELCTLDAVTGPVNDGIEGQQGTRPLPECTDPVSSVESMLHEAPDPGPNGYTAYLVDVNGTATSLGSYVFDEATGMYALTGLGSETENWAAMYEEFQVRIGEFVAFTADVADGSQNLEINEAATMVTFSGTFEGDTLMLTVDGLPEGTAVEGWLVGPDPETGTEEHLTRVTVSGNGAVEYTADGNIGDLYDEFHIHLVGSKFNLGVGPILAS